MYVLLKTLAQFWAINWHKSFLKEFYTWVGLKIEFCILLFWMCSVRTLEKYVLKKGFFTLL